MGVPTSEDGYISATTGRGDHEVHKGHNIHYFIVRVVRLLRNKMMWRKVNRTLNQVLTAISVKYAALSAMMTSGLV
jgi:hypothetical protein